MSNDLKDKDFFIAGSDLSQLQFVMKELFSDKPMNGDIRRDLANKMHAILSRVQDQELPPL